MQFLRRLQNLTLYLYLFSINFEMLNLIGMTDMFSFSKLAAIFYLLTIIPQFKIYFRTNSIKQFLVPIILFWLLQDFMSILHINMVSANFFDYTLMLNVLFFWIMINHERNDYLVIEKGMLSFALGAFTLALLFVFGIGVEYTGGRLSMFGDDQNYIGFRTAVGILIFVLTVLQNRLGMGWQRFLFLIPIPLMLKLISETGSRGAFLTFAMTFVAGIFMYRAKNIGKKIVVIVIGIMIFTLIGAALLESEMMRTRLVESFSSGDTAGRAEIWHEIVNIIKENPVLGVGKTGYAFETTVLFGEVTSPHNVILEILCYTGFVGLLIYSIFFYQVGISSYSIYKKTGLLLPILLMIPILGMIMSIQLLTKKFGWMIYAYIVSTLAVKIEKNKILTK